MLNLIVLCNFSNIKFKASFTSKDIPSHIRERRWGGGELPKKIKEKGGGGLSKILTSKSAKIAGVTYFGEGVKIGELGGSYNLPMTLPQIPPPPHKKWSLEGKKGFFH